MKKHLSILCICLATIACKDSKPNNTTINKEDLNISFKNGKMVYDNFCITCHMANGEGVSNAFPPLAKSDYLMENIPRAIKIVKYGQQGKITVNGKTYNGSMTPLGLSDKEIADVLNYVTNTWGNKNTYLITEKQVSNIQR